VIRLCKSKKNTKKKLIQVLKHNVDAFACSPTELVRTFVVVHTIKIKSQFFSGTRCFHFLSAEDSSWSRSLRIYCRSARSNLPTLVHAPISPEQFSPRRKTESSECVSTTATRIFRTRRTHLLSKIDQMWPVLANAKYFTFLDLLMLYHQVELIPDNRVIPPFSLIEGCMCTT
jgi:hypothetical protein